MKALLAKAAGKFGYNLEDVLGDSPAAGAAEAYGSLEKIGG